MIQGGGNCHVMEQQKYLFAWQLIMTCDPFWVHSKSAIVNMNHEWKIWFEGEVISPMYIVRATDFKGFCLLLRQRRRVGCCLKLSPGWVAAAPSFPRKSCHFSPQLTCSLLLTATLSSLTRSHRWERGPAGGSGRTEFEAAVGRVEPLLLRLTSGGERRPRRASITTTGKQHHHQPPKHNTIPNHHNPPSFLSSDLIGKICLLRFRKPATWLLARGHWRSAAPGL